MCLGQTTEGGALVATTAAELGTAIAAARQTHSNQHPGVLLPLVGVQDLWIYGVTAPSLEHQLARSELYVPQDTLGELLVAPLNPDVLRRPSVWGAILATTAIVGTVFATTDAFGSRKLEGPPNLFGRDLSSGLGYPVAGLTLGGLFTHVGIAEETLFRGYIQSGLARHCGHWCGWAWGSAFFGMVHAFNIALLEDKEARDEYLMISVPVITAVGSYIGASYRWNDYSLAPPVALHFWYDFIISAAMFAADPQHSPLSARISVPF